MATVTGLTAARTLEIEAGSLKSAAQDPDGMMVGAITRDSNNAITSSSVVWPDGSTGTYTALVLSTLFPGAVDSYRVTHTVTGDIYTQPTVTRNDDGFVIIRPAITIT